MWLWQYGLGDFENLVLGSLDVNLGARLPGEDLTGDHPKVHYRYMSFLCWW
jgi:hypothetical protein